MINIFLLISFKIGQNSKIHIYLLIMYFKVKIDSKDFIESKTILICITNNYLVHDDRNYYINRWIVLISPIIIAMAND